MIRAYRLEGEVALVTGASSGLGRRFALTLARAGARVAIAARRIRRLEELAAEIEGFDGRALPIELDVTDPENVRQAVTAAETELGPITILINNSGISIEKRVTDYDEADYDRIMDTNAKGAFFVAQEVGRHMIAHGRAGRIVNIASVAAFDAMPGLAIYAMSKAAVAQMTRAMAREWLRYDINVNAICPGYIATEMNTEYFESELGQKLIARLPRRRIGSPEDLDGLILLLASEASRFMTGSIIAIDDGQMFGL
ncbi:MAG: glucose 1-dehydrogenase [Alphaproteobacteria bacterium]|nr:glucose 1-dehydrogenase [Alphaproteobacteria bacterium]